MFFAVAASELYLEVGITDLFHLYNGFFYGVDITI